MKIISILVLGRVIGVREVHEVEVGEVGELEFSSVYVSALPYSIRDTQLVLSINNLGISDCSFETVLTLRFLDKKPSKTRTGIGFL